MGNESHGVRRGAGLIIEVIWVAHATLILLWVFVIALLTSETPFADYYLRPNASGPIALALFAVVWVTVLVIVIMLSRRYARVDVDRTAQGLSRRIAECAGGVALITVTALPLMVTMQAFVFQAEGDDAVYEPLGEFVLLYIANVGLASGPIAVIAFIANQELRKKATRSIARTDG